MALVDFLNLPEIYRSYGDTNVDRLTNFNLYKDAGRVPVNAFLDSMTFLGDLGSDIPAVAADYISEGVDLYNPFTEEGMQRNTLIPGIDFQPQNLTGLSEKGQDLVSSAFSNLTGLPSYTENNPYLDPSLTRNLEDDTAATIRSKYEPQYINADKIAQDFVFNTLPSIQTYAANNPGSTREAYQKLQQEAYNKKFNSELDKFADSFQKDFFDLRKQNSINMFGYDAFEDPYDDLSSLVGPGLRKFNIGNFGVINQPAKYVGEGDYFLPFMEYEGPDKENLERLTLMTEIGFGIPAAVRSIGKRFIRNTDKINPELDDAIREYMRD